MHRQVQQRIRAIWISIAKANAPATTPPANVTIPIEPDAEPPPNVCLCFVRALVDTDANYSDQPGR